MSVDETFGKLRPVLFMEGFTDLALKELYMLIVTSGTLAKRRRRYLMMQSLLWRNGHPTGRILSQHVMSICCTRRSGWAVSGGDLANEIHLSCCNHVAYPRDIIEHPLNMFILKLFLLYPHY